MTEPYQAHSETSYDAAVEIQKSAQNLKTKVYEHIVKCGHRGATDEEIQQDLRMNPSTQRPRRVDLVKEDLVVNSGASRLTSSNRKASVWIDANLLPKNQRPIAPKPQEKKLSEAKPWEMFEELKKRGLTFFVVWRPDSPYDPLTSMSNNMDEIRESIEIFTRP